MIKLIEELRILLFWFKIEMMAVQKEMGKGFNFHATWAQGVYAILEIMLEFMFIKVT